MKDLYIKSLLYLHHFNKLNYNAWCIALVRMCSDKVMTWELVFEIKYPFVFIVSFEYLYKILINLLKRLQCRLFIIKISQDNLLDFIPKIVVAILSIQNYLNINNHDTIHNLFQILDWFGSWMIYNLISLHCYHFYWWPGVRRFHYNHYCWNFLFFIKL